MCAPPPVKFPFINDCCPDAWTNAPGTGGSGAVGQGLEEGKVDDGRSGAPTASWIAAIISDGQTGILCLRLAGAGFGAGGAGNGSNRAECNSNNCRELLIIKRESWGISFKKTAIVVAPVV